MSDRNIYKGKRKDNEEWVGGDLLVSDERYFIIPEFGVSCIEEVGNRVTDKMITLYAFEIIPETVCRCIEFTDKNEKKIWENDIVKFKHGGEFSEKGIYYRNYVVEFVNTFVTYGLRLRNKSIHFPFKRATVSMYDVEVIGNIFDNPELLGGDAD